MKGFIMEENKIRSLLDNGRPTTSTRMWSPWAFYTEVVGNSGNFDYVEFVAEYAPFTQMDLENIARAAELYHMGSMIKVDFQNRAYVAQKAVASGFQAVLFADHHTPDEVRESLQFLKADSPEHGGRYGCPSRRFIGGRVYIPQMEHAERLNDIVAAFMIEKRQAMENIEEICSIPGVDMVQFGPSDYSMSMGKNSADYREEWRLAERRMIETALKHSVRPRCEIQKPEEIPYYINLGVRDFSMGDQLKKLRELWYDDGTLMRETVNRLEIS